MPTPSRSRKLRHWWLRKKNDWRARWWVFQASGETAAWVRSLYDGDRAMARRLFRAGISAEGLTMAQGHGLFRLIDRSREQELGWVLQRGAGVNAQNLNNYNDTLLHRAAVQGKASIVKLLLKHGADWTILDGNGYSALAVALNKFGEYHGPWENRRKAALALLDAGMPAGNWEWNQRQSILLMLECLDTPLIERLIKAGANPNQVINPTPEKGWTPMEADPCWLFHGLSYCTDGESTTAWLKTVASQGLSLATLSAKGESFAWTVITQAQTPISKTQEVVKALKDAGAWFLLPGPEVASEPLFLSFLRNCPNQWWAWSETLLEDPQMQASLSQPALDGTTVNAWLSSHPFAAGSIHAREAARIRAALLEEHLPLPSPSAAPRLRF